MTLEPEHLRTWVKGLLGASGLEEKSAASAADIFVRASLRGLGHHDLSYLPQRLQWLARGDVNATAVPRLVSSTPGTEVWEGEGGLGEVLCTHITTRAMTLARQTGLAYVGVRHSNHFLAAEPYVRLGAEQGFLILVWSNTDAGMGFPGQARRQIGNNPLGWGLGTGAEALSADLCMAYSSLGNLNSLADAGLSAPGHWGLGPDGRPTESPQALLAGAVGPIGGHKGLALALLGEVLTGVLTGGPTLDQVSPGGGLRTHNQMVLAFDLEAFGGAEEVGHRVGSLRDRAKAAGGSDRLPGDRSHRAEERALVEGISLAPALEADLRSWSERFGVRVPD